MAAVIANDPLLNAFQGRIRPVPIRPGYALALLSVAFLTVLLPLIYLGLIGLVAWLTWWHAVNDAGVFSGVRGSGGAKMAAVAYVGPLVIGIVLVVFMLKPLFARPPERSRPVSIDPRREPRLIAFIERLCDAVGAPRPTRIDVTCEVNASASFRRGWVSFLGNDLVLTIGLNLVLGQNVRQFAGVLAHEFGHFAQGWAMRACYVIRTVNHWFARVVYQRDALDEKLVEMSNSDVHFALNLILWVARGMVWLTRRILWVLMMVGHLFSSLLSRQMEFDADRHAVRLVGNQGFASALRELPVLCAAEHGAHSDLGAAWRERRLADDLPALVAGNLTQIPSELRARIIADGLAESAGMYASHPATRDRIAAGAAEPDRGVFAADGPASQLFADFPGLCRRVTLAWYAEEAGLAVRPDNLVPTASLIARQQEAADAMRRAERLLGPVWSSTTLFAPAGEARPSGDAEALAKRLEEADAACQRAATAVALCAAGLQPDAAEFGLAEPTIAAARSSRLAAVERRRGLRAEAAAAAAAIAPRLAAAPQAVRDTLAHLAQLQDDADELRSGMDIVSALFANLEGREQDERLVASIRSELGRQRTRLEKLRMSAGGRPYPFEHATPGVTLKTYLASEVPSADDAQSLMQTCDHALRNLFALHGRCLSTAVGAVG